MLVWIGSGGTSWPFTVWPCDKGWSWCGRERLECCADASLDDDAYDANVRRRSSIDQTLDELPQPQADSTPTQAADAPPVTEQCAVARNGVPSNGVSKKGTAVHFSGDR